MPARPLSRTRSRPRRSCARCIGAAAAQARRSSCAMACSTSCTRAMCAICSTPRARPISWSPASPPTTTSTKGNYRPHVPQDLRAVNLAAFEIGRLCRHRRRTDAARRIWRSSSPTTSPRATNTAATGLPPKTQEEHAMPCEPTAARLIFTPGDIVYSSSAAHRGGAAGRCGREADDADGARRASRSTSCARRSTSCRGHARARRRRHDRRQLHPLARMIGGRPRRRRMSVLFERQAAITSAAPASSPSTCVRPARRSPSRPCSATIR